MKKDLIQQGLQDPAGLEECHAALPEGDSE